MDSPIAPTSLRDELVAEHGLIARLLTRVIRAVEDGDGAGAMTAWGQFRAAVLAHLAAEDMHLIPALPRAYETNARVLTQEHHHIRERVGELHRATLLDSGDDLRLLYDVLVAHTRNDDRLLYAWLEAQLGEAERAHAIEALTSRVAQATS